MDFKEIPGGEDPRRGSWSPTWRTPTLITSTPEIPIDYVAGVVRGSSTARLGESIV